MKSYLITSNDEQQRLDKFLKKLLPNASLSYIYKLLRKWNIKIISLEWKKTKQNKDYKLLEWEQVQIFLSDSDIWDLQKVKSIKTEVSREQKLSKKNIVFEDTDLLVLNKSAWLNVHPWDHKSEEVSLIEQVHDYYAGKLDSLTFKPSLIHRIDRDTSGIIMIAKTKPALSRLSDDFKKHDALKKTYFCIVIWRISRKSWTIRKKLKRIENAKSENKVQVSEKWLEAVTHYKLIHEYKLKLPAGEQIISTLEVTIETWRMHQIRVHMAALWNPILWDKSYGDKKLNAYFAKYFHINRQMLHAWKIQLTHPMKKKKINIEAPLKKDMQNFITILKK
jgi:23S rRNA pseudouridine955/2504/2580 synthase